MESPVRTRLTLVAGNSPVSETLCKTISTLGIPCSDPDDSWPPQDPYVLVIPHNSELEHWLRRSRRCLQPALILALSSGERRYTGFDHLLQDDLENRSYFHALEGVIEALLKRPQPRNLLHRLVSSLSEIDWHNFPSRIQNLRKVLQKKARLVAPDEWDRFSELYLCLQENNERQIFDRSCMDARFTGFLHLVTSKVTLDIFKTIVSIKRNMDSRDDAVDSNSSVSIIDKMWPKITELKNYADELRRRIG